MKRLPTSWSVHLRGGNRLAKPGLWRCHEVGEYTKTHSHESRTEKSGWGAPIAGPHLEWRKRLDWNGKGGGEGKVSKGEPSSQTQMQHRKEVVSRPGVSAPPAEGWFSTGSNRAEGNEKGPRPRSTLQLWVLIVEKVLGKG